MAVLLNTLTAQEVSLQFREPYVTEGLNRSRTHAHARGVHRGFILGTSVANLTVSINPPDGLLDHLAVYRTSTGYTLMVRKVGGAFSLALTDPSLSGQIVIIAIYASYAVGVATAGYIRAYLYADYLAAPEKDELIVLGGVMVPGTTIPIPASNITGKYRTMAWQEDLHESVQWKPLLKNDNFELALFDDLATATTTDLAVYAPPWIAHATSVGLLSKWRLSGTNPDKGTQSMTLYAGPADLTITSAQLRQVALLFFKKGSAVRRRLFVKIRYSVEIAYSTGFFAVALVFANRLSGTATFTSSYLGTLQQTTPTGGYVEETFMYDNALLTSTNHVVLVEIGLFSLGSVIAASTGDVLRVDYFQAWYEVHDNEPDPAVQGAAAPVWVSDLLMRPSLSRGDTVAEAFNGTSPMLRAAMTMQAPYATRGLLDWKGKEGETGPDQRFGGALDTGYRLIDQTVTRRKNYTHDEDAYDFYCLSEEGRLLEANYPIWRTYYHYAGGQLWRTFNAKFVYTGPTGEWQADDTTKAAVALVIVPATGVSPVSYELVRTTTTPNWAHASVSPHGWDAPLQEMSLSGVMTLGKRLTEIATASASATAPVVVRRDASYRTALLSTSSAGITDGQLRMYVLDDGTLEIVNNAVWSGAIWSKVANSQGVMRVAFIPVLGNNPQMVISTKAASATTWADGAWDSTTTLHPAKNEGGISISPPGAEPGGYTGNEIRALNQTKAWLALQTSNTHTITDIFKYGFDSVTIAGGVPNKLVVTFHQPLADDLYEVSVGYGSTSTTPALTLTHQILNQTVTGFEIRFYDTSLGPYDLGSDNGLRVYVSVRGYSTNT